jgi:hypothetical protein
MHEYSLFSWVKTARWLDIRESKSSPILSMPPNSKPTEEAYTALA